MPQLCNSWDRAFGSFVKTRTETGGGFSAVCNLWILSGFSGCALLNSLMRKTCDISNLPTSSDHATEQTFVEFSGIVASTKSLKDLWDDDSCLAAGAMISGFLFRNLTEKEKV